MDEGGRVLEAQLRHARGEPLDDEDWDRLALPSPPPVRAAYARAARLRSALARAEGALLAAEAEAALAEASGGA